jgi:hypothetical protein|nr:MAG TPA: hypothetical protein [Caudoviricetes sp.]
MLQVFLKNNYHIRLFSSKEDVFISLQCFYVFLVKKRNI